MFLPIGSIVLLKEGTKPLMICSRLQKDVKTEKLYDYVACLYPEGRNGIETDIAFNHDVIDKVLFYGFDDDDNKLYIEKILDPARAILIDESKKDA